ncbi:MAG: ABC transporter ATP-binding protein [Candidatus Nanoarchaeia archaeon]|nr:ABC transporter ATP-binding protein [Candidatus Nanoarchaeia archaeon]
MAESVIEIKNVNKFFGDLKAVDNISLTINKGNLFGLLGPNGSGKTTTVKMLTGQIKPSSGEMNVLGVDVLKDPIKVRELVGIIPELESPPSFLTGEEYLNFVASIRKIENPEKKINEWFNFLEFGNERKVLCKDLSRGTRQKLMFAQAFLHEPAIAFIDEPLINLDPIMQYKVKNFLKDYISKGNTIFLTTHVLEFAESVCTNLAIIHHGRLLYAGNMKDIKKKKISLEKFFLEKVKN